MKKDSGSVTGAAAAAVNPQGTSAKNDTAAGVSGADASKTSPIGSGQAGPGASSSGKETSEVGPNPPPPDVKSQNDWSSSSVSDNLSKNTVHLSEKEKQEAKAILKVDPKSKFNEFDGN